MLPGAAGRYDPPHQAVAKERPDGVKMKDVATEGGSLYDVLQRRISDIHKAGRVNTRSNLLKYITDGPDGPGLPAVRRRVFRREMEQMGFIPIRKRKLIDADRPNPYVSRCGTSYCIRRVGGITGELPRRPRIWTDAI